MKRRTMLCLVTVACATLGLQADDWPEWRGRGRTGVWSDTGIVDVFPREGLRFSWRTPIHAGYSGPWVAGGRVFVWGSLARDASDIAGACSPGGAAGAP
jgi:hypothetical protein